MVKEVTIGEIADMAARGVEMEGWSASHGVNKQPEVLSSYEKRLEQESHGRGHKLQNQSDNDSW